MKFHNKFITNTKDEILRQPNLSVQNVTGIRTYLFKDKMDFSLELRTAYLQSLRPTYYHPWFADFVISDNDIKQINQWKTDVYAAFRIDDFTFSFLYDNLSQHITNKTLFFVRKYPIYQPSFRFSVRWVFVN